MSDNKSDDLSKQVIENWDRVLRRGKSNMWGGQSFYSAEVEIKICLLFIIAILMTFNLFYDFFYSGNFGKFDNITTGNIVSVEDEGLPLLNLGSKKVKVSYMVNGENYINDCTVKSNFKVKVGSNLKISYKSGKPQKIRIDDAANYDSANSLLSNSWLKYVFFIVSGVLIVRSFKNLKTSY